MNSIPLLYTWPTALKKLVFVFTLVAFLGVVIGGVFIEITTNLNPKGVVEQYSGNEQNHAGAKEIKFPKPYKEMLTLIHNHILGLAPLFLIIGLLYLMTGRESALKTAIAAEPLVSLFVTFSGLWVVRYWWHPFVYIVIVSGTLMIGTYGWMSLVVMRSCLKK